MKCWSMRMIFLLGTFCSFIFVIAQENEHKLHLKVIDQDSITLQNVNILINNFTTINTNEDGNASIVLNNGEHNLHISSENYLSRDIKTYLNSSKSLIIVLQVNNIAL